MKYLPLRDFDDVTNALNFDTADCHVIGSCDLYTTKAASGDRKLYKAIENSLESQYESLLRFSASLSPPQAASAAASLNLSRSSPFGSLSQVSSRRIFAYLIATLNASHPDYDFSHTLRPTDFRREKSLKAVINTLDTTLYNLRPRPISSFTGFERHWSTNTDTARPPTPGGSEAWNPRMWQLIDKEMSLRECSVYCYAPEEDPYDGEEGAIWSFNYFFFNKVKKRVCYIYLRGLSIISHSPVLKTPIKMKRSADGDWSLYEPPSTKRARYWLGDRADLIDDGWNDNDEDENTAISTRTPGLDIPGVVVDDTDDLRYVTSADEAGSRSLSRERSRSRSAVRGISEEIAESMDV